MHKVKSCGILVMRSRPTPAFLLLRHSRRFDLPKGHLEAGETELDCALRELREETGIRADQIEIDPHFRYETTYTISYKRFAGQQAEKTLVIFFARLNPEAEPRIIPTEHQSYAWIDWNPPHSLSSIMVDPLLRSLQEHLTPAAPEAP